MNISLWVAQVLLAVGYGVAGVGKLVVSHESAVENPRSGWANDISPGTFKFIGVAEVLGALGMILPGLTGIAPVLTPIAAVGLTIVQVLAIGLHVRRGEYQLYFNVVLLALSVFVAWGRFGPYPL